MLRNFSNHRVKFKFFYCMTKNLHFIVMSLDILEYYNMVTLTVFINTFVIYILAH